MSPSTVARLAARETAAGLAATLQWTGTGALIWLRRLQQADDVDAGPDKWTDARSKLADYGRRLREIADQMDTLCREEK